MHFSQESFFKVYNEAIRLFNSHCKETVDYLPGIDFCPDIKKYIELDESGHLRFYALRDDEELVGYAIFHVFQHLHFMNSTQATQDAIFIRPDKRGVGKLFIAWIDSMLKNDGVEAIYHYVQDKCNYGSALVNLGYKRIESTFVKRI